MVSFPRPLIHCLALMTIGVATGAALAQPGLTRHYTFEWDFEPAGGFDWELPGRYWNPTLRASGAMPETTMSLKCQEEVSSWADRVRTHKQYVMEN